MTSRRAKRSANPAGHERTITQYKLGLKVEVVLKQVIMTSPFIPATALK